MNFFNHYLNPTMKTPVMYGWFHLMWLGILAAAIVIFTVKFRKTTDKTNRNVFLTFTILFYLIEIYKEINFTLSAGSYQWYAFPFQFCSIPFYLFPFMIFLKEGKLKNVFYNFIGTFIFTAGISVMVDPGDVFVSSTLINIQTMMHHSMMVLAGFYVIISGKAKLTFPGFLNAFLVFIGFVSIADILNFIFHNFVIPNDTFNMFQISPYFPNNFPILLTIKEKAPYIVFLISFIVSFSMLAFIALNIGRVIQILKEKQPVQTFYHHLKLLINQI